MRKKHKAKLMKFKEIVQLLKNKLKVQFRKSLK